MPGWVPGRGGLAQHWLHVSLGDDVVSVRFKAVSAYATEPSVMGQPFFLGCAARLPVTALPRVVGLAEARILPAMAPGRSRQGTHAYAQVPEQSVIVGRSTELATLRELLAEAIGGSGSVALIGGEADIGKTALAHVLCTEAEARDVVVLVGRASDLGEMPPYGIWLDMLARLPNRAQLPPRRVLE